MGKLFFKSRGQGRDGDDENGDIYLSPCSSVVQMNSTVNILIMDKLVSSMEAGGQVVTHSLLTPAARV